MWVLLVITVLATLTGVYASYGARAVLDIGDFEARVTAESMALYRDGVIQYYTVHEHLKDHSVDLGVLKAAGYVPAWSTLNPDAGPGSIWRNYRDAHGTIYIYASRLPDRNMQWELARLSRNSYLAGTYRQSGSTLVSPAFGDTGISLAALAGRSVPDNAPVWIAYRR